MTTITAPSLYSMQVLIPTSLGLTLASLFSGMVIGMSYATVPALLLPSPSTSPSDKATTSKSLSATGGPKPATSPGLLSRQWQTVFNLGRPVGIFMAFTGAASFIVAMTQLPQPLKTQRYLLVAAAITTAAVVPYTLTVMKSTNDALHLRANAATTGSSEAEDQEHPGNMTTKQEGNKTEDMIRQWQWLNYGRAIFPLAGATMAVTALTTQ